MPPPRCNYIVETSDDEPLLIAAAFVAEHVFPAEEKAAAEDGADAGEKGAEEGAEEGEAPLQNLSAAGEQFVEELKLLLSEGKVVDAVAKLLAVLPTAVSKESVSKGELETMLQVICVAAQKVEEEQLGALTSTFVEGLTAISEEAQAPLVVKVLFNLANTVQAVDAKQQCFSSALGHALSCGAAQLVVAAVQRLDSVVRAWQLEPKQARALYLQGAEVHKAASSSKKATEASLAMLVKHLETFEEGAADLAEAQPAAAQAIKDLVSNDECMMKVNSGLLQMPAVAQLASAPAPLSTLLQILRVFIEGDLLAFQQLVAQSGGDSAVSELLGVEVESCVQKMRILSLAALSVEAPNGEVSYQRIQSSLQIEAEEVENWVVSAISQQVLDAKMDQQRKVVIVTRKTYRSFGAPEWKQLHQRLAGWSTNLEDVSGLLDRAKLQAMKA